MKKENFKDLSDKELQDRLAAAEKEYVQEKIQHSISPLDNPAKDIVDSMKKRVIAIEKGSIVRDDRKGMYENKH